MSEIDEDDPEQQRMKLVLETKSKPLDIFKASYNKAHETLTVLISENPDCLTKTNDLSGLTALSYAVRNGDEATAKLLLDSKADINLFGEGNLTPCHHAAISGKVETLSFLLTKGGDTTIPDIFGNLPLHFSAKSGSLRNIENLLEHLPNQLDGANNNGDTPLIIATSFHAESVVEHLLERKANINLQNKQGNTALHYACKLGYKTILELLIKFDANIDLKNEKDQTGKDLINKTYLGFENIFEN